MQICLVLESLYTTPIGESPNTNRIPQGKQQNKLKTIIMKSISSATTDNNNLATQTNDNKR